LRKPIEISFLVVAAGAVLGASLARAHDLRDTYVVDSTSGVEATPVRVPEGVAFDPLAGDFYASAVFGGRITRIDARSGVESTFYQETENPARSFIGMKIAPLQRVAWLCAVDYAENPAAPTSYVYAIRIRAFGQGQLLRRIPLPVPFFCNDLALDLAGDVFVTNSFGAAIVRIDVRALWDASVGAEIFAESPLLAPPVAPDGSVGFGMNGIAVTPNHRYLLVVKPGQLLRVALGDPSDIRPVTFTGDAFAAHPDPAGDPTLFETPDGIVFARGKLYVTFLGAIQQLTFSDARYLEAEVATTTDVPLGLTTATSAYGTVYAIDSEIHVLQPERGQPIELPHQIIRIDADLF
jgi:DNA-binding beta-propeller fold protein YncE